MRHERVERNVFVGALIKQHDKSYEHKQASEATAKLHIFLRSSLTLLRGLFAALHVRDYVLLSLKVHATADAHALVRFGSTT